MDIQVNLSPTLLLTIPDWMWKAVDQQHFDLMLTAWIGDEVLKTDFFRANPYHVKEAQLEFNKRRRGIGRVRPDEDDGDYYGDTFPR